MATAVRFGLPWQIIPGKLATSRAFPRFESCAAIDITSPLPLAGEVGLRALARNPGEGPFCEPNARLRPLTPTLPRPSPPNGEREKSRRRLSMQELTGFMESVV
jgi:hypothetical protein